MHNGYFVHYFSPRGLPVVSKDIIFVIDISGSMIGTKMKQVSQGCHLIGYINVIKLNSWPVTRHFTCFLLTQTKAAISTILGDLREGDYFNLITFSDKVQMWKKGHTVLATRQNIRDAREFVKKIVADGCRCL